MSETAKSGDSVQVHYIGKRNDGSVFDNSRDRDEPLAFTLGSGQVIPGFERAVEGMEVGEVRKVRIEPEEAYGERRDDLLMDVDREHVPEGVELEAGTRLQLQRDGRAIPVTVTDIGEESVTLDANHPLAGEELNFEIELVDVG
jgi:FKBP-type peptidyl-prolyl cis-trans isomerase 2